jgi:flagellar hook-basal body complex protein FliE
MIDMNGINAVGLYPIGIDEQYELIRKNALPEEEIETKRETFKDVMGEFLAPANESDLQDKISNADIMLGNADNLHSTMIAGEYADLSLKLTTAIRNKVVDAYNEVMRMQI